MPEDVPGDVTGQGPHGQDGWRDVAHVRSGAVVDEATGGQMLGLLASVAIDLLSSQPGVSIIGSGRLRTLCARPDLVHALDLVQIDHGGPSIDAIARGEMQTVLLSEHLTSWAELVQKSREVGYTSIHAFPIHALPIHALPIRGQARVLGALSLYSTSPALSDPDLHIANGIARAAAAVIVRTGDLAPEQNQESGEHRSGRRHRVRELRAALELIGAGPDDLFIRYFAIGGTHTRSDVDAIMAGRRDVSAHELETIDLAVDELVDERRRTGKPDRHR